MAAETMRQLVCALSGLEKSQSKAATHVLSAPIMLDDNLKLIRQNAALSASSLPVMLAKEAYHLPLDPTTSGLLGTGLSAILERGINLTVQKWQRALHEAAVNSVKTSKALAQHRTKQAIPGVGLRRTNRRNRSNLRRRVASLSSKVRTPLRVEGSWK